MPKILNKHKDNIPPDAIYVGRPSKWGNPFIIGKDGTRDEVIEKCRSYILGRPDLISDAKLELKGHDLVCFCAPKNCHALIWMEIANAASN